MNAMIPLIVVSLLFVSALCSLVLGLRLSRSLTRYRIDDTPVLASELPSVSVCIPARNEMNAMTKCLERVLASNYKKLEIVVFDDSSIDATSIIIRSFAQAGVRFVAGKDLPDGWLGKNYALDVLAREASGTYVIFMDVDTIITPTTVSRLVAYMRQAGPEMTSVIPTRDDGWRLSVLFGHLRYFWELTIKGSRRDPSTASALWMIDRHVLLHDFGGIAPFRSTAAPEAAIAATLGRGRYGCLVSDSELGVAYEKKWLSQIETGRRLFYPKIGGTRLKAAAAVCGLVLLNLPSATLLAGFFTGWSRLQVLAASAMLLGMGVYGLYTRRLWRRAWLAGACLWPFIVGQELSMLIISLWGYWRGTITWKGRSISPSPLPGPSELQ